MARLRFPGRPGYRFDRIGVRYGADEARQTTDATLAVVASIHRGLKRFKELIGDSDEVNNTSSSEIYLNSPRFDCKHGHLFLCCLFCLFYLIAIGV